MRYTLLSFPILFFQFLSCTNPEFKSDFEIRDIDSLTTNISAGQGRGELSFFEENDTLFFIGIDKSKKYLFKFSQFSPNDIKWINLNKIFDQYPILSPSNAFFSDKLKWILFTSKKSDSIRVIDFDGKFVKNIPAILQSNVMTFVTLAATSDSLIYFSLFPFKSYDYELKRPLTLRTPYSVYDLKIDKYINSEFRFPKNYENGDYECIYCSSLAVLGNFIFVSFFHNDSIFIYEENKFKKAFQMQSKYKKPFSKTNYDSTSIQYTIRMNYEDFFYTSLFYDASSSYLLRISKHSVKYKDSEGMISKEIPESMIISSNNFEVLGEIMLRPDRLFITQNSTKGIVFRTVSKNRNEKVKVFFCNVIQVK